MGSPFKITIDSIFGGHSKYENFFGSQEFHSSLNIDPDMAVNNVDGSEGPTTPTSSGFLRPNNIFASTDQINGLPYWITPSPKSSSVFLYDSVGSVYTVNSTSLISLSDLNDGGTSSGNGAAYYDNYLYFARDTTVARYGPLNGSPAFTDDYWSSTLSKTALTNTTYPSHPFTSRVLPNHVMHRHLGALYFGDVVGNQGVLHKIQTTNTSGVEGDTDNGSTFNVIDFPFGMWPSAIESYGDLLAVALYENVVGTDVPSIRAKVSFWNITDANTYESITDVEFPDPYIFALLNSNGILYTFSGELHGQGVRVCRFVGGYSFEQVAYLDYAYPPFPGGVEGKLNKILFGSSTTIPVTSGCVYAIGSKKSPISTEVFNIYGSVATTSSNAANPCIVTSLKQIESAGINRYRPFIGWSDSSLGTTHNGMNATENTGLYGQASWRSQVYRLGQPFKITKFRIPVATDINGSTYCTPTFYIDNIHSSTSATIINPTNYPGNDRNIVQRPVNLTGNNNFQLQLDWKLSTNLLTLGLPISIYGEFLED